MRRWLAGLTLGLMALSARAAALGEYSTNGVSLSAGFIPDTTGVMLGEPVFVTFVVSNRGDKPFLFSHVRNEIFSIVATNAGGMRVKSWYLGLDGNGHPTEVAVLPGKTHVMRVFLNERCAFDQPGEYRVVCQGRLGHYPPGEHSLSEPVVTEFKLRVRPPDPVQAGRLIAAWGGSVLTNGSPEEAAQALAEFNDVRTIPHLALLVTNRPAYTSYLAVNALTRYTNEAAAAVALTSALGGGEDYVASIAGSALRNFHQAGRAAGAFLAGLTNADASARIQAAKAVSWTGSELALEPLRALLRDPEKSVRYAAAQAIGRLGRPESLAVLTNLLADPDFTLRIEAVRGLILLGRPVEPEWVKPMILSGGENVRTYYDAIDLLRMHGKAKAAPGLAGCLNFDDPSVKHAHNFRVILALEFSPNGPKHYYKWRHDPNRDGTEQELAENRRILSEIKAWLASQAAN